MKNKNRSILDVNYKSDTTWLPPEIPEMEMVYEMRNDVTEKFAFDSSVDELY